MNVIKAQSVSSVSKYNKCPALYRLHYVDGIQERSFADAKDRGTCVHAGLDVWLRTKDVVQAQQAALNYSTDTVPLEIRQEAAAITGYYAPHLPELTPVEHRGSPMIEFKLDAAFNRYGVAVQGILDAVVQLADGRIALIDWKVRGSGVAFYHAAPLANDRQLIVYAAVLHHIYGIPVDVAYQVQMNAVLPSTPKQLVKTDGTLAAHYNARVGPTTNDMLQAASAHMEASERAAFFLRYMDKVKPDSFFLDFTEISLQHRDKFLHFFLQSARRVNADTEFIPVHDAYVCKSCSVLTACRAAYLGEITDVMG